MGVPPATPLPSKMYMVRELRWLGEAGILGLWQTRDRKELPTSPSVVWKLLPTGCGNRQQDWGLVVFSACLLCLVMAAERTGYRLRRGSLEAGADKGLSTAVFANGRWCVLSMGFISPLKQASLHCLHITQQNSSHRFLFSPALVPFLSPLHTFLLFSPTSSLFPSFFVSFHFVFLLPSFQNKGKLE